MNILGISAYYHDSAAALICNGEVLAAAQEERFTRVKNDKNFPINAIKYCLTEVGLSIDDLDAIVFYDKPFLKFERLLETYFDAAPKGWLSFITAMPVWLKQKLFLKSNIKKELKALDENINWDKIELLFSNHHFSHAASAFYATNFKTAAILTIDGAGEWATASIAVGDGNKLTTLREMHFPDSVGLLYSAFTYYLGFEVNAGEYKVMGLAPYVAPNNILVEKFFGLIKTHLVTIFDDGSIKLNQKYFSYSTSLRMINKNAFEHLFELKTREPSELINFNHIAIAQALQLVTEEVILNMATYAKKITGCDDICLAGGVALNCVANGKLQESKLFKNIFIQPAAGDSGAALGAAWAAYYLHFNAQRKYNNLDDNMKNARLGPLFTNDEIEACVLQHNLAYIRFTSQDLIETTTQHLLDGKIVGWFQGRMEFGPRALGGRSILANPLMPDMQSKLNLKVKKREGFRPFAPIMLQTEFERLFGQKHQSPYMLFVHKLLPMFRKNVEPLNTENLTTIINQSRSVLPSITHVDFSSRIQTVTLDSDELMFKLLNKFKEKTGFGVVINTSFNLNNEPIVCTPQDAITCFLNTDIDVLVIENIIIEKQ